MPVTLAVICDHSTAPAEDHCGLAAGGLDGQLRLKRVDWPASSHSDRRTANNANYGLQQQIPDGWSAHETLLAWDS